MGRLRRIARVGLVSLLLGVGTTYGVAWWLMNTARPAPRDVGFFGTPGDDWSAFVTRRDGITWVTGVGMHGLGKTWLKDLPSWSVAHRMKPSELEQACGSPGFVPPVRLVERGAGWPMVAVTERRCDGMVLSPATEWRFAAVRDADVSIRWGTTPDGGERVLALMPAWPGFAVDAVCFAAAWGPTVWGAGVLRRRMRVRAGRCAKCRYDLSGLMGGVCPECGEAIQQGAVNGTATTSRAMK